MPDLSIKIEKEGIFDEKIKDRIKSILSTIKIHYLEKEEN